jgi:uncharacterized protein involved in response to NO
MVAALAAAAAVAQATRLLGWKPLCSVRNPLLWILHVSYGWIPVGFLLLSLAALKLVPASAAIHVLAIGSIAGLIIGMVTRTTLGHTGRMLKAGTGETAMYGLMQLGVLARLIAAVGPDTMRDLALGITTASWSTAFVIYLLVYGPYLFKPRVDGREG